jgi:hypothetical protein
MTATQLLSVGNGGWVRFDESDDSGDRTTYARFALKRGRLGLVEVYLPHCTGVRDLRAVPLAEIEAAVNAPKMSRSLVARLDVAGPLLNVAASHFATTFSKVRGKTWVTEMMASQTGGVPAVAAVRPRARRAVTPEPISAVLDVPASRPYGDDFYRQVASVYSALSARVRNPASVIADANAVPVTTAHRWVKQARERGFLGAGQQGKRG